MTKAHAETSATPVSLVVNDCAGQQQLLTASEPVYLTDFLTHIDWQSCDYAYGAVLSFPERVPSQSALQARLIEFVTNPSVLSKASSHQRDYFEQLAVLLAGQPVTGRRALALIDPKAIELTPNQNPVIRQQAYLQLVNRPTVIQLVGFETVALRHVTSMSLSDYLATTQRMAGLVAGEVYVVQANGQIDRLRYGAWTFNSPAVSPGAWVIALAPNRWIKAYPTFNEDLAQWLATQVLP